MFGKPQGIPPKTLSDLFRAIADVLDIPENVFRGYEPRFSDEQRARALGVARVLRDRAQAGVTDEAMRGLTVLMRERAAEPLPYHPAARRP